MILKLLQIADSALPIGGLAHSFGLETMIEEGHIDAAGLFDYLKDLLTEVLLLEAVYCREAHRRALAGEDIGDLNARLNAIRLARESREASVTLGRRFLSLARTLEPDAAWGSVGSWGDVHLSLAFGYFCGLLSLDGDQTVAAFLHQNTLATISVCQRLLPLGQVAAARIAWDLKPFISEAVARSAALEIEHASNLSHLPELASMRHPGQRTRLFVS